MAITIPVAHDFICPWCWIAFKQAERLESEFDVEFEWRGYELYPEELDWPQPGTTKVEDPRRPKTPSRLALAWAASGVSAPTSVRPHHMRTHNAHEAVAYATAHGSGTAMVAKLYRALWEDGREINSPEVIAELAAGVVDAVQDLIQSVAERRYRAKIVAFDDPAHENGVFSVPTFWVNGKRLAEEPYEVVRTAIAAVARETPSFYKGLAFPEAPEGRPWVAINMVATIDGKTAFSDDGKVLELGSSTDHHAMHQIERAADAVLIGATTLRAAPRTWRPRTTWTIVATASGDVPVDSAFLSAQPEHAIVLRQPGAHLPSMDGVNVLDFDSLQSAVRELSQKFGIRRLVLEGGSSLNAEFLAQDLVDELFLTVAPKVALGAGRPTYAGGQSLPPDALQRYAVVEHHVYRDEVFLRYRRIRA